MVLADRFGFSYLKEKIEDHLIFFLNHRIKALAFDNDIKDVFAFHSHALLCSATELQKECEKFFDNYAPYHIYECIQHIMLNHA